MNCSITALAAGVAIGLCGSIAQAGSTTVYGTDVTSPPGWFDGTGNPNGGFTVATTDDGKVEVGLRAKYRHNPNVINPSNTGVYTVVPGPETSTTNGGNGPGAANRAAWNYEFSINTNPGNSANPTYTLSNLAIDFFITDPNGHSTAVNPITYWPDNSGYGPSGRDNPAMGSDWVAQNSENPNFGDFPLAAFYNMNTPGTYTFSMDVYTTAGVYLLNDTMKVTVVPLPKAAYAGLGLIAGIGVLGGLKRRQRKLA
jgi:hypothetical protein